MGGLSAILLTACGNSESIVGRWEQPVPGLPMLKQGFILEEGDYHFYVGTSYRHLLIWNHRWRALTTHHHITAHCRKA